MLRSTSFLRGPAATCAALAGLCAFPTFVLAPAYASAAASGSGTPLVNETFTGATADPRFHAYGPACLTGAAQGADAPSAGGLGGCGADAVGPVPPDSGAPHGYLRLTDASPDQSAAVLFNQPLPAAEGLSVSFDQWQYGGTPDTPTSRPADGIAFFLVDGESSLTSPGAFGGSLGYAQKLPDDVATNPFLPGVAHGYVGVGLDVLGNYFGDWERRGYQCPAGERSPAGTSFRIPAPGPNMVTLRGPGDGTAGYCFLTATTSHFGTTGPWPSTLPGELQGPTTSADLPPGTTPAEAQDILRASQRTVTVTITPAPNPQIRVTVDFHNGTGPHQVLDTPAPQPIPPTYKFGFSSSTGQFTDVHLIRTFAASSVTPLPALDLVKQLDESQPLPENPGAGSRIPYQFVVRNSGGSTLTDLFVADPVVEHVSCPVDTLHPEQETVCTGTYTVTREDVERGYVHNEAIAHAHSSTGPLQSPPSDYTVPLGGRHGLELEKEVDASRAYAPGETATYSYLVTNVGDKAVHQLRVTDDRVTGITCPVTSLAARDLPGSSTVCTGRYLVTDADAQLGHVSNTAVAHAEDGAIVSPPARARIEVKRMLPPTGVRTEDAMEAGGVLVAVGATLLLIRRKRRELR